MNFINKLQNVNIKMPKILNLIEEHKNLQLKIEENKEMLCFEELKTAIKEETEALQAQQQEIVEKIKLLLTPPVHSLILEIRAAEGGDESSLFAYELMQMYQKVCKLMNFQMANLSINQTSLNGLKDGVFEIVGENCFSYFFCETGVHCVKRVPKTEKKGRVHTSTATVAILRQPNAVEIKINEADLKIETFRASGAGGQHVNTTDSAVRITHIPTKIVVSQQDERSQHKNKEKAMKILKARLFVKKQEEEHAQMALSRKNAIGSATRTEKIRTYHFTQNYVKDARVDQECHDITSFMEGNILKKFIIELQENFLLNEI